MAGLVDDDVAVEGATLATVVVGAVVVGRAGATVAGMVGLV